MWPLPSSTKYGSQYVTISPSVSWNFPQESTILKQAVLRYTSLIFYASNESQSSQIQSISLNRKRKKKRERERKR